MPGLPAQSSILTHRSPSKAMTKILVIEDNPEILGNIVDLLEAEEFDAIGAPNGRIGVELAQQQPFDLVLCDVMMPELDGYGVLTTLRQSEQTANIPFIFLTAKGERTDLRHGMTLGADDYITKPFTPLELQEAIATRLEREFQRTQELQQVSKKLSHLEQFDSLTGLPNASALAGESGFLNVAISQTKMQRKLVPFLLVGIDRLGRINEAIGYDNGNRVLQQFARRLNEFSQEIGAIGVARTTGDEFAVILPPTGDRDRAGVLAQWILEQLAQPFEIDGKLIPMTASIGISIYPFVRSLEELQRLSRIALGAAKKDGGNQYQFYTRPTVGSDTAKDLQLAADLRQAWDRGKLQVFYQPRVDLRKKKLVGLRAVVAWKHPQMGLICADKIYQLAEESGWSRDLDEWVFKTACQQAKLCQNSRQPLRLSVPLSAAIFNRDRLIEIVVQTCQTAGFNSSYLELEIEADTVARSQHLNAMALKLMNLRKLGISITLSNFGIGHTAIDYLGNLAINRLKLDRSLTQQILQNPAPVGAIAKMARGFYFGTVATGVETDEQAKAFKKQKCDEIQQATSLSVAEIQQQLRARW